MPLLGRPYTLILLELEDAITSRGETRPLIVEAAYRKVIQEYSDSLTEDDRICLGAFRIIMEELAKKNLIQVDAAREILSYDVVGRWGEAKVKGWATMKPDHRLAALLMGISSKAKAAAHDIIVADGKPVPGSNIQNFDFEDLPATKTKITKVFLHDIVIQNENNP